MRRVRTAPPLPAHLAPLFDEKVSEQEFIPRLLRSLPQNLEMSFCYTGEFWVVRITGPGERVPFRGIPSGDLKEAIRLPLAEFYERKAAEDNARIRQYAANELYMKLQALITPLVPKAGTHPSDVHSLLRLVVLSRNYADRTVPIRVPKRRTMGTIQLLRSARAHSRYRVIEAAEMTEDHAVTVASVERLAKADLVHLTTVDIMPRKGSTGVLAVRYVIRVEPAACALIDPHLPPLLEPPLTSAPEDIQVML